MAERGGHWLRTFSLIHPLLFKMTSRSFNVILLAAWIALNGNHSKNITESWAAFCILELSTPIVNWEIRGSGRLPGHVVNAVNVLKVISEVFWTRKWPGTLWTRRLTNLGVSSTIVANCVDTGVVNFTTARALEAIVSQLYESFY